MKNNFAYEDGIFLTVDDSDLVYNDLPVAFELTLRGVIHRMATVGGTSYYVLEVSPELKELWGEETNMIELQIHKLVRLKYGT